MNQEEKEKIRTATMELCRSIVVALGPEMVKDHTEYLFSFRFRADGPVLQIKIPELVEAPMYDAVNNIEVVDEALATATGQLLIEEVLEAGEVNAKEAIIPIGDSREEEADEPPVVEEPPADEPEEEV